MNTSFYPVTLDTTGVPRTLENPCEFFFVHELTGTVLFRDGRQEWCPLRSGYFFRAKPGETFTRPQFKGGGSITLIAGAGDFNYFGGSTGGGTTMQIYTGAFADPNGNIIPTDTAKPALYYDDPLTSEWAWSVINQSWTQLS